MVPSHSLDCRPERAVDLFCFIQETVLIQIFNAVVVLLSLHAASMIPCPVGLVKIRLPSCQLTDVNGASSWRISQAVASKMARDESEMLAQGMGLWVPGTACVKLQTGQLVSYGMSLCPWKPCCWVMQELADPLWCCHFSTLTMLTNMPLLRLQGRSEWNACVNLKGSGVATSRKDLAVTSMVFQHMYK